MRQINRSKALIASLVLITSLSMCGGKRISDDVKDAKSAFFQFFEIKPLENKCPELNCKFAIRRVLFLSPDPTILEDFYCDSKGEVHYTLKKANPEILSEINRLREGGVIEGNARKYLNSQKLSVATDRKHMPGVAKNLSLAIQELSRKESDLFGRNCIDGLSGFIEYYQIGMAKSGHYFFSCSPRGIEGAYKQIELLAKPFRSEKPKQ